MKKLIAVAMSLVLAAGMMTACGGSSTAASTATSTAASTAAGDASTLPEVTAGMCQTPIVVTSVGQSADVDIVDTLCNKAGLTIYTNSTLSADDLTDQYKTLILAVGGSSKGLGAAGIDENQELERTAALMAKAKELGITVLAMHTGGSARRGTLSDKFITPAFQAADVAIVVSEGDADGLMAGILAANSTPSSYVASAAEAMNSLKTVFGVQ